MNLAASLHDIIPWQIPKAGRVFCRFRDSLIINGTLLVALRQESECIQDRFSEGEWVDTVGFALLKKECETTASEHLERTGLV